MDFEHMDTKQKVMIFGVAALVAFFLIRALASRSGGTTTITTDTAQIEKDMGSIVSGAVGQASQAFGTQMAEYQKQEQQMFTQMVTAFTTSQQQTAKLITDQGTTMTNLFQSMQANNNKTLTELSGLIGSMSKQNSYQQPADTHPTPTTQSVLSQLASINQYVAQNKGQLGQGEIDQLHKQKEDLARSAGWSVDDSGFVKDSSGKLVNGAQPITTH